tara:strand:- start:267 stop:1202 length:936 start_codon:yes stop_codon:yes gene_type:complete
MEILLLSVIVCTYNRVNLLGNCLASLCEQDLNCELFEIIVVDNNSGDNTYNVVSGYMKKKRNIRYVTEKKQGLSYARNRGCDEARSQYLLYIDDDALAPPGYLSNILDIIKKYEPDLLGGPVYPYYTEEKPRWFKDEYEIRKSEEKSGFSHSCRVSGSNYTIKESILKQVGMFDVSLGMKGDKIGIGEERKVLETYREKTPRDKQKVYYALGCYIKHHVPQYKMKIRYLMERHYVSGKIMSRMENKKHKAVNIILLVIKLPLILVWRTFRELMKHGPIKADYIDVWRSIFFNIGWIVEALNQGRRKKFITI